MKIKSNETRHKRYATQIKNIILEVRFNYSREHDTQTCTQTTHRHKDALLPARFAPLALLVETITGTALFHTVSYNINTRTLFTLFCEIRL
jgi:hypothetical protein